MDEDDDEDAELASEGSSDDDPYQVKNPMHDILVNEGEATTLGLIALAEVVPLVPGKNQSITLYF